MEEKKRPASHSPPPAGSGAESSPKAHAPKQAKFKSRYRKYRPGKKYGAAAADAPSDSSSELSPDVPVRRARDADAEAFNVRRLAVQQKMDKVNSLQTGVAAEEARNSKSGSVIQSDPELVARKNAYTAIFGEHVAPTEKTAE